MIAPCHFEVAFQDLFGLKCRGQGQILHSSLEKSENTLKMSTNRVPRMEFAVESVELRLSLSASFSEVKKEKSGADSTVSLSFTSKKAEIRGNFYIFRLKNSRRYFETGA